MAAEFAGDLPRRHVPQDHRLVRAARAQLAVIVRAVKRSKVKTVLAAALKSLTACVRALNIANVSPLPVHVQHFVAMAAVRLQERSSARAPQLQAFIAATRHQVVPISWKTLFFSL